MIEFADLPLTVKPPDRYTDVLLANGFEFLLAGGAAFAAGAVNALAGGGTLITFPTLMALGIPAVAANVTNTVALSPGYFGATMAQWKDLQGQNRRLWVVLPVAAAGGLLGGFLLLNTGEKLFRQLVPFLILLACLLLASQERLRKWLQGRAKRSAASVSRQGDAAAPENQRQNAEATVWAGPPVFLAAVYGGYFGAGLSVIVLAMLGFTIDDSLTRLNALKQAISFSVNMAAAFFFLFSGEVVWPVAAVMAVGALIGGAAGGRLAGRIAPSTLRRVVVAVGLVVALVYFVND